MPDAYKAYANAVIKKYGKVDEVKAPAEALSTLLQKEGVTNEQLQEVMPEVAKQLRESKPTDEVVIPIADVATHLAPLKGFPEMANDLRVGDELTPREGKAVLAEVEAARAAHAATEKEIESGESTPARKVYDEVFDQLTKAGHAPEVARPDATMWAAFAKARGERLGIDPYEYFKKRIVSIGAEFADGPIELGQGPDDYGGSHRPPDPEHGAPLYDLTGGGKIYPDDVYGPEGARIYGHGDEALDTATMKEIQRIKGNPDAEVTIYRAIPKDATDADIHTGDWITVNRKYAEEHGQRFEGGFKIVSKDVRARELFTDGNSIHEAGYWRGGAKPPSSEAFKKWFKGSKIKDEEGNPLVVYHGTTQHDGHGGMPFKEFRTQPEYVEGDEGGGVENVSGMDPTAFLGAHFAKERGVAKQFARGIYRSKEMKEQKGHIFDVYLSIKNPVKMTETEMRNRIFQQDINSDLVEQYLDRGDGELDANFERYSNDPEFRQQVNEDILLNNALGYEGESDLSAFAQELADGFKKSLGKKVDGIIYKNEGEGGTSYIAFNPSQIKSIHNMGAFDPRNPNILEQAAYHGSPYKFSKFTLDHLGSGEGSQAFGWGLYFAEAREVAEFYKRITTENGEVLKANVTPDEFKGEFLDRVNKAIEEVKAEYEEPSDWNAEEYGEFSVDKTSREEKEDKEKIAALKSLYDRIDRKSEKWVKDNINLMFDYAGNWDIDLKDLTEAPEGALYEVDLPEKKDLFDYDRPISENKEVFKKLEHLLPKFEGTLLDDGSGLITQTGPGEEHEKWHGRFDSVPEELRSPEWKGAKEEQLAKLIKQYEKEHNPDTMTGREFYQFLSEELGGDREASLALNAAGIPGLKFLDRQSRYAKPGEVGFYGDRPSGMRFQDPEGLVKSVTKELSERVKDGATLDAAFKAFREDAQEEAKVKRSIADSATEGAQPHKFEGPNAEYHNARMTAEGLRADAYKAENLAEWLGSVSADEFQVEEGTHNFVIWNEDAIKILDTLEQKAGEGYRGKISFDPARSYFNITLTGKANLSTFLHESGHAFLEFMRADAMAGAVDPDLAKIYEYLGVKAGEEPSVDQLERFARSFEAYLREGKAPSTGLREAFRAFGAWLKMVYKSISGLGVDLNDDIRGVMDRMLATDKEIEDARENLGFEPMKKPEKMDPKDYATYKERFAKAVADTKDRLQEQALRAFSRVIGEERSKVKEEVEAKIKADPAHNAFEALATGKRLDGAEVPEEVRGQKISRAAIEDYPGYTDTKKWTSITDPKGGLDPETLAPYYGFGSGQEMLDALNARRPRSTEVKEETDRRMAERYPDADMGAMAEQAVKAFHEEGSVEKVLWAEAAETAKYLAGLEEQHAQAQGGERDLRIKRAVIKELQRRRVEGMTALEMQPGRFARAEETAAEASAKAFKEGDFQKAHEEKLTQIANHILWKLVSDAKEETESIRDYLNRFNEVPTRRRMGKAGQSYVEAIDKIITDIELKRVSNKEIARRASLEAYLKKMEDEDGAVLTIPEELRSEASLKNYKTMTLEELRTVRDAVKNIESMARLKNQLYDGRAYRAWNATGVKAAEHVRANLGTPYAEKKSDPQNPGWWDKKKMWLREAAAEKKKIEFLARELDGGQTAGFMHELLFQPFATAEARRHTLTEKITEALLKPLREMGVKERMILDRTVDFLGTPMRMRDVLAVALNMGNDGNKKKLIDGYGYRGWTEEAVTKRLGELLTDKHLDLVQHFWDTIGQLWPDIKELSERTTGLAPPKVEPTTLTINGRELKGGYYPIVYDRARDYKAEQIAQKKGDLWENNFLKPGVSKGFTETRTQFHAPLLLSLNVIPSHINEVVHYITHYEAVRAVDRLLNHKELRKSITEGLGRESYNLFRPWLQAIAHDGVVPGNLTLMDGILRHLRVGAAVTRLGLRLTNSIMQGFNLLSSVKELGGAIDGPKYLSIGVKRWMEDVDSFRDPFAGIYSKSPELAGKASKIEHEMVNDFDRFTSAFSEFGNLKNQLGHFAMSFMTLAWKTCDTITWYAAREKAMDEGHPRPLEYADSVVRMSQMGEGIKDKAALMRGGEGVKIFTNMYSWYSVIYNQLTETQPVGRGSWAKTGELASRWWWMVIAPSVAMGLARGKGPSKDKDAPGAWLKYYGEEIALEAAKPWPVAGVVADTLLGEHEAKFAPWISTVLKGIKARGKAAAGEHLSDGEKKALVESTGITSHLPATALWNAYRYVSAVTDGKLQEPIRDLLFRAPGEWK
jgi:hypothetical protein